MKPKEVKLLLLKPPLQLGQVLWPGFSHSTHLPQTQNYELVMQASRDQARPMLTRLEAVAKPTGVVVMVGTLRVQAWRCLPLFGTLLLGSPFWRFYELPNIL